MNNMFKKSIELGKDLINILQIQDAEEISQEENLQITRSLLLESRISIERGGEGINNDYLSKAFVIASEKGYSRIARTLLHESELRTAIGDYLGDAFDIASDETPRTSVKNPVMEQIAENLTLNSSYNR